LNPGRWLESTFFPEKKKHQENSYGLKWLEVKEDFLRYLESIDYNERTMKKAVN
jgi:hypothetical protein